MTLCVPAAEIMCIAGCSHWAAKRCMLHGSMSSEDWPDATLAEIKHVPRVCRLILAVYEEDVSRPKHSKYRLNPAWVIRKADYEDNRGKCPPYLIYLDHDANDVALAIRGLHLRNESDYALLLDNRRGQQMFDGGYVHHGLLKVAGWLLEKEFATLQRLLLEHPDYTLTIAGHSLGSGVAALMTIILVNSQRELGGISRKRITCYAIAPARSTSMNLAIRYADCIKSVVLQDDFLPRTSVPLHLIFGCIFCLPCLLTLSCIKDTFLPWRQRLGDPRRLCVPGRLYHIVYTEFGSCKTLPPKVRTAIPVDGRFEQVVCSKNATEDHSLANIERMATEALRLLEQEEGLEEVPSEEEKAARARSLQRDRQLEQAEALQRAVSLGVYNAKGSEGGVEDRIRSSSSEPRANGTAAATEAGELGEVGLAEGSGGGCGDWDGSEAGREPGAAEVHGSGGIEGKGRVQGCDKGERAGTRALARERDCIGPRNGSEERDGVGAPSPIATRGGLGGQLEGRTDPSEDRSDFSDDDDSKSRLLRDWNDNSSPGPINRRPVLDEAQAGDPTAEMAAPVEMQQPSENEMKDGARALSEEGSAAAARIRWDLIIHALAKRDPDETQDLDLEAPKGFKRFLWNRNCSKHCPEAEPIMFDD